MPSNNSSTQFDVIVAGIGGHGSAAAYHLARRGQRVLGLEKFAVGHTNGSSHDHEDPRYVPLLRRSYELWDELQKETGVDVIHITGGLDIAAPSQPAVQNYHNAVATVQHHNLEHEVLTAEQVNERFPGFSLPPGYKAVYQAQGGIIAPEHSIRAHAEGAKANGAVIKEHEPLVSWSSDGAGGVVVTSSTGNTYRAKRLILAAGAWMPQLVPPLQEVCSVERQVIGWFDIDDADRFRRFPISIITDDLGAFYTFPPYDHPGLKIGKFNHLQQVAQPDQLDKRIHAEDEQALRSAVARHFPHANGKMTKAAACMFTNSTDHAFIIDWHPSCSQVLVCSACSGHGYKFASVIGEILADLATTGETRHDIDMHRISRQRKGHERLLQKAQPSHL